MPNLITTPSNGSPILAYGSSSRPHGLRRSIIFAVIGITLLVGSFFAYLNFGAHVELPTNRIFTVAVMPKTVQSALNGQLIASLPPAWRVAIESNSRTPILFGWSLAADNVSIQPFAVIPRFQTVVPTEGIVIRNKGFTRLLTQGASETENVRMRRLAILSSVKKYQAGWTIDAAMLKILLGLSTHSQKKDPIYGTWDGPRGAISLAPSHASMPEQRTSDILVTLRGESEEIAPLLLALGARGTDLRDIASVPQAIFINASGTRTIWNDVSDQDIGLLNAGFGHPAIRSFAIPDQSDALEFFADLRATASGTPLIFETNDANTDIHAVSAPSTTCPGTPRLIVSGDALRNTLDLFHASEAWKAFLTSIRIHETGESGIICVNE